MDACEKPSAYAELKALLVYYRFAPGEQLRVAELATRLRISTTPVREALNRLHAEGFLVLQPHRGFFAKALSLREMTDLYEFGYSLLKYAVETSIDDPRAAPRPALDALIERVAHIKHEVEACATGVEQVLEKVMSFTQNDVMQAVFHNFHERTHYVRLLQLQQPRQMPKRLHDLHMLMESLKKRDRRGARAVLDAHWKWKMDTLPDLVKEAISRHYA